MKNFVERSVVDTNVLISSFIFPHSFPALALSLLQKNGIILASNQTLIELEEVLSRPKFDKWVSANARNVAFLSFLLLVSIVEVTETVAICVDPKDDKFLSLAVSGNASLILTGDDHLLRLHPFRGIDILKPVRYLERNMSTAE